jgi:hypothetical protein
MRFETAPLFLGREDVVESQVALGSELGKGTRGGQPERKPRSSDAQKAR